MARNFDELSKEEVQEIIDYDTCIECVKNKDL